MGGFREALSGAMNAEYRGVYVNGKTPVITSGAKSLVGLKGNSRTYWRIPASVRATFGSLLVPVPGIVLSTGEI
jgi:hypothetical protein